MSPVTILLIALSMSADAFAAAVARGAAHRPSLPGALRSGLVFGVVEAITPLVGWALGKAASRYVEAVDHWIAFGLLTVVGGRMIYEALTRSGEEPAAEAASPAKGAGRIALVATALGTSIDAAVVGGTLALIDAPILVVAAAIGCATFVMASTGLLIGRMAGAKLGSAAEVLGGLVLIGIGVAILLEHTHMLG